MRCYWQVRQVESAPWRFAPRCRAVMEAAHELGGARFRLSHGFGSGDVRVALSAFSGGGAPFRSWATPSRSRGFSALENPAPPRCASSSFGLFLLSPSTGFGPDLEGLLDLISNLGGGEARLWVQPGLL